MNYDSLFFDLDGTLTDSSPGITKCAQLALRHFAIPADDLTALRCFIGPPLRETFPKFGVPANQVEEAVAMFRSRYLTVGKFENAPYPGIHDLLEQLQARGYQLFVATSKPESTAIEILEEFQLASYFKQICGATMDGSRDSKESVIRHLLSQVQPGQVLMIGDTVYDVLGAKAANIPTLGVTWGFGTPESLLAAGALGLAASPQELLQVIVEKT